MASSQRESATIYEFPLRGRFAAVSREREEAEQAAKLPRVVFGSSWYHDAAIEAERARNN